MALGRMCPFQDKDMEIPVYWHTLAHIPKCILEKIRIYCFNFLWRGSSETRDYTLQNGRR